jgi:hypothetical protein
MGILDDMKGLAVKTGEKMSGVLGLSKKMLVHPELKPQSDEEKRKVGIIQDMIATGKLAREPWEPQWKVGFEYSVGKQGPQRRKRHRSKVRINYLWRNTEAMVSRLTNNNPTINVVGTDPESQDHATGVQKLIEAWWDDLNMRDKLAKGTRGTLTIGDKFYYTYWDHEANQPCTELRSAKNILVNPEATSLDDCTWMADITKMPIWQVWQYWPKAKGKVAPGGTTTADTMKEVSEMAPADPTGASPMNFDLTDGTTTYRTYGQTDYFGDRESSTDMVQVVSFWIRDPARTTEQMFWDDGLPGMFPDGTPMMLDKPKYPGGRNIVLAGSRIVHDEPNPFAHGEFPYVKQSCFGIEDEFWSKSFVYEQINPQAELNKTLQLITENQNLMSQPRVIADRNSGFDPEMDTAKPGTTWWKNPGTEVKVVDMPGLPSYVVGLPPFYINAMKELSGVTDSSTGFKEPGVQSGVALQTLAMQSHSQSGILEANLEDAIRRIGKQWVGLARQFVTEARYVQTTTDTGEVTQTLVTPEMIKNEWKIRIGVGSTLPVDRNLLMQQAAEWFQIGLFDQEAALKWGRHPETEAIMKRVKAQKAEQAQMQQQMAELQGQMGQGQEQIEQLSQGAPNGTPEMPEGMMAGGG